MRPLLRHLWRTGEVLDPSRVNDAWNHARQDGRDVTSRRYMRTPVVIPWGEFDQADVSSYAGLLDMYLKPPFGVMLTGLEVVANFSDGSSGACVGTLTATGIDGWKDVEFTSDGTIATDVLEVLSRDMRIDAAQEVKLSVSFDTATYTVERLDVVLWMEADRLQGGTSRPMRGANEMEDHPQKAGTSAAADHTEMHTELDANFLDSSGAEFAAANRRLSRITVHVRWDNNSNNGARKNEDYITGGADREIYSWDHYATGTAANNSDIALADEAAVDVFNDTLVYATTTAKNQGNVINETHTNLDPADSADFYELTFDDGLTDVGAGWRQVVVLYWL